MGAASAATWVKGRPLGSGAFGVVFKAFDTASLRIFAVREVPVADAGERQRLVSELSICQSLRHPNLVSYLGHECEDHHLHIFFEYVPGGSMANFLAEFCCLEGKALWKATRGMLEGLGHLHTRSPPVVHRDLRGANLLIDAGLGVKLADFGCSTWNSGTRSFATLGSGCHGCLQRCDQQGCRCHGCETDIWSAGCTVLEMATAERPWGDSFFNNITDAMRRIATSSARARAKSLP